MKIKKTCGNCMFGLGVLRKSKYQRKCRICINSKSKHWNKSVYPTAGSSINGCGEHVLWKPLLERINV